MIKQAAAPVESDVLSPAEMRAAIASVSEADLHRLRKAARIFSVRSGIDPDDLLQEAIVRALEDTRHCRRDLTIIAFLIGAMKSLASAHRKKPASRKTSASLDDGSLAAQDALATAHDGPSPEEIIIDQDLQKKQSEAVFGLFRDDDDATLWLMARMDADTLAEAQAIAGFDTTKMNTVGRRVRRKIERNLPRDLLR